MIKLSNHQISSRGSLSAPTDNSIVKQKKIKVDPILASIQHRIQMDKYVDDFYVLTEGAKQRNMKKEEKLSVAKQIKTVLQEKVNEDTLKKLHRRFTLDTFKKNLSIYQRQNIFNK